MAPGQFELTYVRGWAGDPTRRVWLRAYDPVHRNEPPGDEEVFPGPFTFDIERVPNEHVAFGFGKHFCLGNSPRAWCSRHSPRPEGKGQSVGGA